MTGPGTSFADPGGGDPGGGDLSRNVQVNLGADVSGYSQNLSMAQQQTEALAGSVGKLTSSIGNVFKNAGRQLFHFSVGDVAGLSGAVADAALLERQLSTLRATSVVTGSSMSDMTKQIDNVFSSFPVARAQVVQLSEAISNMGTTAPKNVGSAAATFTKLGAATGEDPIGLAQGSLQISRQMGNNSPDEVAGYANSLLTVSKNQGVAASGVLQFSQAIAPMARAAGIGQAAVYGISAAFQKAGADGSYAANTFSKITGDISQLSQTGSPDLAKYASFVGKSTAQFKTQSPTSQITSLFTEIAKGGPEALSFMNSIGYTQRDIKAVQGVTQSGDLSKAIADAQGSTGNTTNLDAASKSAFSGLNSSVDMIRNQFTRLGDMIGGPLLTPLTKFAQLLDVTVTFFNKIVSALGPIPGYVAAIAGALAIPAGMLLTRMGLLTTLTLGRQMFGAQSAGRIAARAGSQAGQQIALGATESEAMMMTATGRRIKDGLDPTTDTKAAPLRTSVPYMSSMTKAARDGEKLAAQEGSQTGAAIYRKAVRDQAMAFATYGQGSVADAKKLAKGATAAEGMAATTIGQRVAAGTAPAAMEASYMAAMAASQVSGKESVGLAQGAKLVASRGVRGGLGALTWGMNQQTLSNIDSSRVRGVEGNALTGPYAAEGAGGPGFVQSVRTGGTVPGAIGATGRMATSTIAYGTRAAGAGIRGLFGRGGAEEGPVAPPFTPAAPNVFVASPTGGATVPRDFVPPAPQGTTFAANARVAAEADARQAAWRASTGVAPPVPIRPVMPAVLPVTGAAGAAGAAEEVAGKASRAGSVLGGPIGMIGAMVAIPLIGSLISAMKEQGAARADVTASLKPTTVYDQMLDRASTNLAKFGDAVNGATSAASKLAQFSSTPLKQLTTFTDADKAAVADGAFKKDDVLKTITDKARETATKGGGSQKDIDAAVQKAQVTYLEGQGIKAGNVDGATFSAFRQQIGANLGSDKGAQIKATMDAYAATNPGAGFPNPTFADYGTMAATANQQGGDKQLNDFKSTYGEGVQVLRSATTGKGTAGTKAELSNTVAMAGTGFGAADAGQDIRIKAIGEYLQQQFGIDPAEYQKQLDIAAKASGNQKTVQIPGGGQGGSVAKVTPSYSSATAASADIATAIAATTKGKSILGSLGPNGLSAADLFKLSQDPGALPPPDAAETTKSLIATGPLGKTLGGNARFLSATTGMDSTNPGAGAIAQQDAISAASKLANGNMGDTAAALRRLSDAVGGATGDLLKAAAVWEESLQGFTTVTMSRAGQLASATHDAAVAQKGIDSGKDSGDTLVADRAKVTAGKSALETQRQYMISQIVAVTAFNTAQDRATVANNLQRTNIDRDFTLQQGRASDAYNLQVKNANEDFNTQQVNAAFDANEAKLRAQDAFQLQSQRSLIAYQLQVTRTNEDHATQLKRQALASAQDIYDPFTRIQAKATTDAGTLIYNLQEQNGNIEKQMAQIAQLKKMGLSQGSIDTLKLTDSGQSQEVDALLMSLKQNPNMTKQINAQTKTRLADTTAATQTPDSLPFRQAEEDFHKNMSRQATDFHTQVTNAAKDYSISAGYMATDTAKLATRAQTAQTLTMKRMGAAYTLTTQNAVHDHQVALDDMAKAFKVQQDNAAADLITSFKEYTGDFNSIFSQLSTVASGAISKTFPSIAADLNAALAIVKTANPWITGSTIATVAPALAPPAGTAGPWNPSLNPAGKPWGHAYGGVSLARHEATISEHGPELVLPLNSRGQDFMAGLIHRSLVQGVTAAISAAPNTSMSMSNDNTISFNGADIKVVAQDPNEMARQLAAKAKLARLASPVRH